MRRINSLRSRLILVMAAVFTLGVVNVAIYLLDLDNDVRDHVFREQIEILLAGLPQPPAPDDIARLPHHFSASDWRYALYAADGRLIAHSPAAQPALAFIPPLSRPDQIPSTMAVRAVGADKVLILGRNDWAECEELCQIFRDRMTGSVVVIAILALISLISIRMLSDWALGAVHRAAALAATISKSTPDRRIPLEELPVEILPLARSANIALDRLAEAYAMEKRFTGDAAHELRTPLAVLDLRLQNAEMGVKPDWQAIRHDMDEMRHLLQQLLDLARLDHENLGGAAEAPVAVARILRDAAAAMLPACEAAGRALTLELSEGLMLARGGGQLRQAVRNLLDNALKHGQGRLTLSLQAMPDNRAVIRVSDEGPAAAAAEAELLFDRFRKGRQSEGGTGLGLAIVRQAMANLGGTATIAHNEAFCVELVLPLS